MGIGANILGYADDDVDTAVKSSDSSISSSLVILKRLSWQLLIKIHPWANMVRYTKRRRSMCFSHQVHELTRRDKVLFNGYHGWYDWYLDQHRR